MIRLSENLYILIVLLFLSFFPRVQQRTMHVCKRLLLFQFIICGLSNSSAAKYWGNHYDSSSKFDNTMDGSESSSGGGGENSNQWSHFSNNQNNQGGGFEDNQMQTIKMNQSPRQKPQLGAGQVQMSRQEMQAATQAARNVKTVEGQCKWTDPTTGIHYDLSGLKKSEKTGWVVPSRYPNKEFFTNVCGPVTLPCPNSQARGPAAAFQFKNGQCESKLGVNTATSPPQFDLLDRTQPKAGVVIHFENGDPCGMNGHRTVTMSIKCNDKISTTKPIFASEPDTCQYVLEFEGPDGCPARNKIPFGYAFLICFAIIVVVYLVGGAIYLHKYKGASGQDMVPHREFWEDFPVMAKEGIEATSSKAKELYEKYQKKDDGSGTYENV